MQQQSNNVWGRLVAQTLSQLVGQEGNLEDRASTPPPNDCADTSHEIRVAVPPNIIGPKGWVSPDR